jgi:hypothetical protein
MDYSNYSIFNPKDKLSERIQDEKEDVDPLDYGIDENKITKLFNDDDELPSQKPGFIEFYKWKDEQTNHT